MTLPFDRRLALFHWLLDLFEARSFDELAQPIKEARFEGFDADNITHFHHALAARPLRRNRLTKTELLGYDENISATGGASPPVVTSWVTLFTRNTFNILPCSSQRFILTAISATATSCLKT